MAIVRWDPFRDLMSLQDRMNRLFEESLGKNRSTGEDLALSTSWSPAVDIYETEDKIILKAELPGLEQKDIDLQVHDNTLTLKGERKFEKEIKEENFHRMERSYGAFSRTFSLPSSIDQSKINATFKNGILEVSLPKSEEKKPKKISVKIEQ